MGVSIQDPKLKARIPRGWGKGWTRTRGYHHWVWNRCEWPQYPMATLEKLTTGWVLYCYLNMQTREKWGSQSPEKLRAMFIAWRLEHGL